MSWWESAYRSGHVNWDPGEYDRHLPWLLEAFSVTPCRAVDLGCGTGQSAVWLAERGFEVVGIDLAPTAVRRARELARRRRVTAVFLEGRFPGDFPRQSSDRALGDGSFGLVVERGFLQHLGPGRDLQRTLARIAALLRPGGVFYSLITAREQNRGAWGPRLWSESEVRGAFEGLFTIRHMELSVFTAGEEGSISAWLTVSSPR